MNSHALAGDRVAYYDSLVNFCEAYGGLALGVVLNNTLSGASANEFFLNSARDEDVTVTPDQLARISLELMLADNQIRQSNSGEADVDQIQEYHESVFGDVAGVSSNAWTPDYYLRSFDTLEARQSAWEGLIGSGSFGGSRRERAKPIAIARGLP